MYSTSAKIIKPQGEQPNDLELSLSQTLIELTKTDMKASLQELFITGAKEIDIQNRKAVMMFVPAPQLRQYHKIQVRLIRELEKKYSGKHFVIIAQRRILPKPTRKSRNKNKQKRPRSRTLTMVQDNMLEDICFPADIVGKRIRFRLDGSRLTKVHLDKSQETNVEHKIDTFSAVYKRLTGKEVTFEFRECDTDDPKKKVPASSSDEQ